jgi:hypothetical protein
MTFDNTALVNRIPCYRAEREKPQLAYRRVHPAASDAPWIHFEGRPVPFGPPYAARYVDLFSWCARTAVRRAEHAKTSTG